MSSKRLEIIFEDDFLIAVNKPCGWISVPGRNADDLNCVAMELQKYLDVVLPVHRIDKDTSGTLLFVKTAEVHKSVNQAFADRKVEKRYAALLHGDLKSEHHLVNMIAPTGQGKMKVVRKGKKAESTFYPQQRFGLFTWCHIDITTGRTHQIRVHASHLGHPLVGDDLYGGHPLSIEDIKSRVRTSESSRPLINRSALHALSLGMIHPVTRDRITLESPLPKDLKAALNQLNKWKRPIED